MRDDDKKLIRKLKRRPRYTLRRERNELQLVQKDLRERKAELDSQLRMATATMVAAMDAKNDAIVELSKKQIERINTEIERIVKEYKENSQILEIYSKILKNDKEGNASTIGSIVGAATGATGIYLGIRSLTKAYETDTEGKMKNRGVLDIFNKVLQKLQK